jgi:hypothetical protein
MLAVDAMSRRGLVERRRNPRPAVETRPARDVLSLEIAILGDRKPRRFASTGTFSARGTRTSQGEIMETIDSAMLVNVTGGNGIVDAGAKALKVAGKVGKFAGKAIPIVNAAATAYSAYEGYNAYQDARKQGKSVGSSLWEGVKAFVW